MLKQSKMDMLATLLAIGIDPKTAVIFHQDDVGVLDFPVRRLFYLYTLFFVLAD